MEGLVSSGMKVQTISNYRDEIRV